MKVLFSLSNMIVKLKRTIILNITVHRGSSYLEAVDRLIILHKVFAAVAVGKIDILVQALCFTSSAIFLIRLAANDGILVAFVK